MVGAAPAAFGGEPRARDRRRRGARAAARARAPRTRRRRRRVWPRRGGGAAAVVARDRAPTFACGLARARRAEGDQQLIRGRRVGRGGDARRAAPRQPRRRRARLRRL